MKRSTFWLCGMRAQICAAQKEAHYEIENGTQDPDRYLDRSDCSPSTRFLPVPWLPCCPSQSQSVSASDYRALREHGAAVSTLGGFPGQKSELFAAEASFLVIPVFLAVIVLCYLILRQRHFQRWACRLRLSL